MAGFETHIATSTAIGIAYAVAGRLELDLSLTTCALAGGLCSIGGMLPDLDSDTGAPARETVGLTAAIVPMLLMPRLQAMGYAVEQMILVGAPLYLFVRFVLGGFLKGFTVHRGMFHSIPAMVIAGLVVFLLLDDGWNNARLFKAGGVCLGFLSHLVLDEIYSFEVGMSGPRFKRSFGTAVKFFGSDPISTAGCYGLLILLGAMALREVPQPTAGNLAQQRPFVAPSRETEDRLPRAFEREVLPPVTRRERERTAWPEPEESYDNWRPEPRPVPRTKAAPLRQAREREPYDNAPQPWR